VFRGPPAQADLLALGLVYQCHLLARQLRVPARRDVLDTGVIRHEQYGVGCLQPLLQLARDVERAKTILRRDDEPGELAGLDQPQRLAHAWTPVERGHVRDVHVIEPLHGVATP
jgi:hypothetical protein